MIAQIRESLSQAPPWATYGVIAVILAIPVAIIAWELAPEGARSAGDKRFYCPDCDDGFTVSAEEARTLLREAAKANPGERALVKCPKCGQYSCVVGMKCPKCGKYFEPPEKSGSIFPDSWRDECPHCGYSGEREKAVKAALKQKREGTYDPDKIPGFIREAVEEAEESGEHGEQPAQSEAPQPAARGSFDWNFWAY